MPSLMTHLKVAESVNMFLKLDDNDFCLGNVLPDLTVGNEHKKAHFNINRISNINDYLNNFKDKNLNAIEIGYLCHLLTDKFFNEFIFKNYIEINDNKLVSITINKIKHYYSEDDINDIKHAVYDLYDNYLLDNNLIEPFKDINFISQVQLPSINGVLFDEDYLKKQLENINNRIEQTPNSIRKYDYKFSSQEELDSLLKNCINYMLSFLEKNNIIKQKITIGIDFDGTITEYYEFLDTLMLEEYDIKKVDTTKTSFYERYGKNSEDIGYKENEYFDVYFNNVNLKKYAKETINKLFYSGYDIYIITNRNELRRRYIEEYLKKHGILFTKIFCLDRSNYTSKIDIIKALKVNVMVEDNPYQLESIGKETNVICINNSYNQNVSSKKIYRVTKWKDVYNIVTKKIMTLENELDDTVI